MEELQPQPQPIAQPQPLGDSLITLSSFCFKYGLNKGTVHRDCKKLGITTNQGLTAEAVNQLITFYNLEDSQPIAEPTPVPTPTPTDNPTDVISTSIVPSFNPSRYLVTSTNAIPQPLAIANHVIDYVDKVKHSLDSDIAQRKRELDALQEASRLIESNLRRLENETGNYKLKAEILDMMREEKAGDIKRLTGEMWAY